MYHYVYKTTIINTGEYYIGKHTTDSLNDNYIGSGISLREKVDESTPIHFEILQFTETEDEAYELEERIIGDLWKTDPLCLNRVSGGRRGYIYSQLGVPKTEEWKQKIGKSNSKPKSGKALEACRNNAKIGTEKRRGQKDSKQVCEKRAQTLSKTLAGVPRPYRRKRILIDGQVYVGVEEVVTKFKVSRQTVHNRIKSPNWNWQYEEKDSG
jgi:hypothetical protein